MLVNMFHSTLKLASGALVSLVLALLILISTNPQNLPAIFLLLPFVFFFLALFLAILAVNTYLSKNELTDSGSKNVFFSFLMAGYPTMLILLQSIGQLSVRDVITLTLICGLSAFYVTRSSFGE